MSARRLMAIKWWPGSGLWMDESSLLFGSRIQLIRTYTWNISRRMQSGNQWWIWQHDVNIGYSKIAPAVMHVTAEYFDSLHAKFDVRIISQSTIHHRSPYSPDLSSLNFSFWFQVMAHIFRCDPSTDLKSIEEDFAADMREEDIRKMVRHTKKRAELCKDNFGEHFEHLMCKR